MNTYAVTTSLLTHSLGWALLYSLWQGALIYGTLYILLKAMPDAHARIKYYLSFAAFSALFIWFADTWLIQYQKLKGITVYITSGSTDTGSATYAIKTTEAAGTQNTLLHDVLLRIEQYFPLIVTLYAVGLMLMLSRFLVDVMQVRALRKQGIVQPDTTWQGFIADWQDRFDISRPVKLLLSNKVNTPMMLGVIKPIILLPIATMTRLTTAQVEAILLHELAHIKRHDYLLNMFQTLAETVLFFNPFVWLISRIIRQEREHCCDDMVVAHAASPLSYAQALTLLEESRMHSTLALAATGNKNQLFNRIKRIMEMKKNNINYSQLTIIVVAIIAITFSIAMFTFTPSFAQKIKTDDYDTTTAPKKKTVYKYKSVTVDENGRRVEKEKEVSRPGNAVHDENVMVSAKDDDHTGKTKNNKSFNFSYTDDGANGISGVVNEIIQVTQDALKNVDWQQINKEVADAQKEADNSIDWDKINKEVKEGLADVNKQLKELDDPKIRKEIKKAMKEGLEESKKALEEVKKEAENNRHVVASINKRNGAHAIIMNDDDDDDNGPAPMPPMPPMPPITSAHLTKPAAPAPPVPPAMNNDYGSMLAKMEKDGLIDRSDNYKVEKEDDALYINGEKQSDAVYNKYSRYLQNESVKIKGHDGHLSISIND